MKFFSETFEAGTLRYRWPKFLAICFYLLWGGFFYSMLAYVLIPTLLPLTLKNYGATGILIGLICGSLPQGMNLFLGPVLSTSSDRKRTRWGRRIPYLAIATPFVVLFMVLMGWTPQIVTWLQNVLGQNFSPTQTNTLVVALLCVFAIFFQVFNLFVGNIYYYLLPDVLPEKFIGKFLSILILIMGLAGFAFNYFLLKYATDYSQWVYTGVAVLFLISFIMLCTLVKEGDYPPPAPMTDSHKNRFAQILDWVKQYGKECFSHPFFVVFFLGTAINQVSTACRNLFNPLFATQTLNLTEAQFGHIMGLGSLYSMGVVFITGLFIDRLHPLRVFLASGILIIFFNFFGYFWAQDYNTFFVVGIGTALVYALQNVSSIPMMVALMPKDKFGQFCSANSVINCLIMIVANYFAGLAVDCFGYRVMFIWDFIFTIVATAMLFWVYFQWKKLGGAKNYQPPKV